MRMSEEKLTQFDYYRLAKAYEKTGQLREALDSYSKAIAIAADYAHAWYYKAELHYRLKEYKECIECAQQALTLQPSWSDHINRLIASAKAKQ